MFTLQTFVYIFILLFFESVVIFFDKVLLLFRKYNTAIHLSRPSSWNKTK